MLDIRTRYCSNGQRCPVSEAPPARTRFINLSASRWPNGCLQPTSRREADGVICIDATTFIGIRAPRGTWQETPDLTEVQLPTILDDLGDHRVRDEPSTIGA